MVEEDKFASTWNASQGLIMEIIRLKTLANQNYALVKIEPAIQNLIAAKQTIIAVLSSGERTELKDIEKEFFSNVSVIRNGTRGFFQSKEAAEAHIKQFDIYDRYNEKLMDFMQSHDLLLGEKTDVTKFKG